MAPAKKRQRRCPGCDIQFTCIASHWRLSSTCNGVDGATDKSRQQLSEETIPGPVGTGTSSIQEDEDQEQFNFPDDLSVISSSGAHELSISNTTPPPAQGPTDVADEQVGMDQDDLYELFITDCSSSAPSGSAVTEPPAVSTSVLQQIALLEQQDQAPIVSDNSPVPPSIVACGLESGAAFLVPPDFQKAKHCFTNQDRSLLKLYNICDQADHSFTPFSRSM